MAAYNFRKLVLIPTVLVLMHFNQNFQIQCTPIGVSLAGTGVLINPFPENEQESEAILQEAPVLEYNKPVLQTDAGEVTGSDERKKRQQHRALLNEEAEEKDDEESEAEIAAEISPEKDTKYEPTKAQTQDDPESEETVHQLYGVRSLVNPLKTSKSEQDDMGQSETAPELDSDSDSIFQTAQNEEEEGKMDQQEPEEEVESVVPQLYGSGKLVRPVQNDESEATNVNGGDGGDGFITEDYSKLKENVLTHVLDVELVTDGYDCNSARGPLTQVSHESKFFVDAERLYNFKEAREVCNRNNLVIAEIEEVADHRTIQEFLTKDNGKRFFIGLNDIKTEGVFQHANGKNATYQNFLASQPDDKDESEDCVTIMKEHQDSAAGAADYDCNKTAHVFCMHRIDTQCYNDSKETIQNRKHETEHDLHLLVNASERAYFVSNYQLPWKEAMMQCDSKQMKLFDMDAIVNMGFFRAILRWENNFFRVPMPTVQYWTSGKFKKSHMTAPIIWHTKPDLTSSEERGIEKHNSTFSFSGLYKWSTKKKMDPGGPHGWRKDLCVSFGFDSNPEAIPFTRNTNCDLPTYFICYAEYPDDGKGSGEETTTPVPINPVDKPFPLEPENETETAEIEAMFANDGRNLNMSCDTNDEKDDVALEARNGIAGNDKRWWDGISVYIDPSYDRNERKIISAAMNRLRASVCVHFYLFKRNQSPNGDYVHIKDNGNCFSKIGKKGGRQDMSLARGCLSMGTIMHEFIHALGFWHEHSRPDRDRYVNILWKNILRKEQHNFYKKKNVLTFGVPYNTVSIMHYRSWEFSSNGEDTILDKRGRQVGSLTLQQTDIDKLKKMYNCRTGGGGSRG